LYKLALTSSKYKTHATERQRKGERGRGCRHREKIVQTRHHYKMHASYAAQTRTTNTALGPQQGISKRHMPQTRTNHNNQRTCCQQDINKKHMPCECGPPEHSGRIHTQGPPKQARFKTHRSHCCEPCLNSFWKSSKTKGKHCLGSGAGMPWNFDSRTINDLR